jgi:O-antigen/teichoic acid export membrane protein
MSWKKVKYLLLILGGATVVLLIRQERPERIWVFPLLLLSNLAIAIYSIATIVLNAGERHWPLVWLNLGASAARVLLPPGFVFLFGSNFWSVSSGFTVHGVVLILVVLLSFHWTWRSPSPPIGLEQRWLLELCEYGRPFVWLGVGGWLLQFADRWVVSLFFGDERAGIFSMASNLGAYVPNLAMGLVMQRVFPAVFREADIASQLEHWRQLARRCDKITMIFFGLALGGLGLFALIGPQLVGGLIDQQYAASVDLVFMAGLSMLSVQINQFQYLLLQGQHNSADMVKVMLVVSGTKTIGSVLFACISWNALLCWISFSVIICGFVGRRMVHKIALHGTGAEPLPG